MSSEDLTATLAVFCGVATALANNGLTNLGRGFQRGTSLPARGVGSGDEHDFSAIQRQYDTKKKNRRRVDTAALNVSCPGSRSIHPPSIEAEHRIASRREIQPTNPPTSQWHAPRGVAEIEATTMTSDTNSKIRRNRSCFGTSACTHKPTAKCKLGCAAQLPLLGVKQDMARTCRYVRS